MFKFREIHEINEEEAITDNQTQQKGYLNIKPTERMTDDEIHAFIMAEFAKAAAEAREA